MAISTHRVVCLGQYESGYFTCQDVTSGSVYMFSERDYASVDFRPRTGMRFNLTVDETTIRDHIDQGTLRIELPDGGSREIQHHGLTMYEATIVGVSNVTIPAFPGGTGEREQDGGA